jgi:hypothetical protein
VLADYRLAVEQLEARLETVAAALVVLAQSEPFRQPVGWLRCFRGSHAYLSMARRAPGVSLNP